VHQPWWSAVRRVRGRHRHPRRRRSARGPPTSTTTPPPSPATSRCSRHGVTPVFPQLNFSSTDKHLRAMKWDTPGSKRLEGSAGEKATSVRCAALTSGADAVRGHARHGAPGAGAHPAPAILHLTAHARPALPGLDGVARGRGPRPWRRSSSKPDTSSQLNLSRPPFCTSAIPCQPVVVADIVGLVLKLIPLRRSS